MIHAKNWVFMHCSWKTLRNNKVKNTLGNISTWQDCFRKNSNLERCLNNLELLNQPLDQTLIDFDKENQNSYEKYHVTIMTERKLMLQFEGIGQTWNPTNPGHHKASNSFANHASEVMQMKASTVPPNLTRDLEAKIETQDRAQSLHRDPQTTHDWLSEQLGQSHPQFDSRCLRWWKFRYNDTICQQYYGTSNQSPTSWEWPRADPTTRAFNAQSSTQIGCSSEYATSEHSESSNGCTHFSFCDDFFSDWKNRFDSDSPWLRRTQKKERSRGNYYWQMASANGV